MTYYLVLRKGRKPFKAGTKRRYGNYIQIKKEGGWQEYPIADAIADRDIESVTKPGSTYKDQSHPPKRMHELTPTQRRKLHAMGAASGKEEPKKTGYKKKVKAKGKKK